MPRHTISLSRELKDLLDQRAAYNHRSLNGEIIFLIEAGLASEIDGNVAILRTLMMAQGGIRAAHIATDEPQPETLEEESSHP